MTEIETRRSSERSTRADPDARRVTPFTGRAASAPGERRGVLDRRPCGDGSAHRVGNRQILEIFALGIAIVGLCLPLAAAGDESDAGATEVAAPDASKGSNASEADRIEKSLLMSYLVDQSAFTLFDARSPAEYEAGHVDGAVNLPIEQVVPGSAKLPSALDEPILVYCKTGRRASVVAASLKDLGYSDVRVLPSEQLMFHDDLIVFNCGS